MSEFIKTKASVLNEQNSTIEGERRRFNQQLMQKQNDIESLKENLGVMTKRSEDLHIRSEYLAVWTCQSKMLTKLRLL